MVMRKYLLATATVIALVDPAMCADMRAPVYKAAPPVVPVWSWTGCYVGGHAGGLWAKQKDWIVRTPGGAFFGQSLGGHEADGWLGGVQAGCDYQFAAGFLIGVQGDYAWADAEGSHDSAREIGVGLSQQSQIAGERHRPPRLRLGALSRLRQRWRRLGARRLLGDDDYPRHGLYGA
jgi:opacity protein-like surface antigen